MNVNVVAIVIYRSLLQVAMEPHNLSMDDDLNDAARQVEVCFVITFSLQCSFCPLANIL